MPFRCKVKQDLSKTGRGRKSQRTSPEKSTKKVRHASPDNKGRLHKTESSSFDIEDSPEECDLPLLRKEKGVRSGSSDNLDCQIIEPDSSENIKGKSKIGSSNKLSPHIQQVSPESRSKESNIKSGSTDNFDSLNIKDDSPPVQIRRRKRNPPKTSEKDSDDRVPTTGDIFSHIVESHFKHLHLDKISQDIVQLIADHCNEKLTETLNAALHYMEQCGRSKFTVDDFNKGLSLSVEYPVKLYRNLPPQRKKRGRKPNSLSSHYFLQEIGLNERNCFSMSISDLEDELQDYFKAVIYVLDYNMKEESSLFIDDLQTNRNILQLVPHLINMFSDYMNEFKSDFLKMTILFTFVDSLLRNPNLDYGKGRFLSILSCAVLKFLVASLPYCNQNIDCWMLKDIAANILPLILKISQCQTLFFEIIYFVDSILTSDDSSCSHYGALAAVNAIGVLAVLLLLPSYIDRFVTLVTIFPSNVFQLIQGQIITSYYQLVHYYNIKNKPIVGYHLNFKFILHQYLKDIEIEPFLFKLRSTISDFSDEALVPTFPLLNFTSGLRKKKELMCSKETEISNTEPSEE